MLCRSTIYNVYEQTTGQAEVLHFSICARHPCAGAMLIFPVSFQFSRMIPEGNLQTSCGYKCSSMF